MQLKARFSKSDATKQTSVSCSRPFRGGIVEDAASKRRGERLPDLLDE
jgi:hypothetical protein